MQTDVVLDEGVVVEDIQDEVEIVHLACQHHVDIPFACGIVVTDGEADEYIPGTPKQPCVVCREMRSEFRKQHKDCRFPAM